MINQHLSIHERLELFTHRSNELSSSRFVQTGMQSKFNISGNVNSQQVILQVTQPDEENLRSFLLVFRQFISDKEPIYFPRILNDCIRFLDSSEIKDELLKAQEHWRNLFYKIGAFQLEIDNNKFTGEYVLDLWLNGYYFHNDPSKKRELDLYVKNNDILLVRFNFLTCLPAITNDILYVCSVVDYGLKKNLFHIAEE